MITNLPAEKRQLNTLFLIGSSILYVLLASCNNHGLTQTADLSDDDTEKGRVENLVSFLNNENICNTSKIDCCRVVLFQTNVCNACREEYLKKFLVEVRKTEQPLIIILSGRDEALTQKLKGQIPNGIYHIAQPGSLTKYNLSFIKNLKADICNSNIESWEFQ